MTLNITQLEPELIIPFITANHLNLAHRVTAIAIMLCLVIIFAIACITLGTWSRYFKGDGKKGGAKLALLLNFSFLFCLARLSAETLRTIAFSLIVADSDKYFNIWLDNVSRAWGIFLFIGSVSVMLLLIESWMDVCKTFIQHPKAMVWSVRAINFIAHTILLLAAIPVAVMLCFKRETEIRNLAETLLKFAIYPIYVAILAILVLEITIIGIMIMVIVRGKLKQAGGVILTK
jgi:hypothetical protein